MDAVWKVNCDVVVEEYHVRTGAREGQWTIKQSRIVLQDEEYAKSAVLYVPRHGQSIPVKLLGAEFTIHANFLSQGKCSIRVRKPVNLSILMSNIPASHSQAIIHLLNAVSESRRGKPNGGTSTSLTGEGDYHANDQDDLKRRTHNESSPSTHTRRPLTAVEDKENQSQNLSRPAQYKPVAAAMSPKRFLSPRSVRFLQLSKPDRARVLERHPALKSLRQSRFHSDPQWASREAAYEAALLDTTLSTDQRAVLQIVFQGKSVFFTGGAGTGKSHLIHKILACLPGVGTSTYATSTTGITAMALQGTTVYAWAGLGVLSGYESASELAARVSRSRESLFRWRSTRSLLIDEISMMDGQFFQTLHQVAQLVRGNDAPFGGIQLILCGDFLQLPPVARAGETKPFAFEAACWSECVTHVRELRQVYRQKDGAFVHILDEMRRGLCSEEAVQMLRQCEHRDLNALSARDGIRPTSLLTLKKEVDEINARELASLPGAVQVFLARDTGVGSHMTSLAANCPARDCLELKVGAQVILVRNLSVASGLCNGSRGVVLRFASQTRHPIVRFSNGAEHTITPETWSSTQSGRVMAQREAIPLDLAWAISIHKSQGMSLDRARVHLATCFEYGQAYVALSRLRSLDGLQLVGFDPLRIRAHPAVLTFYDRMERKRAVAEATQLQNRRLSPNTLRRLDLNRPSPPPSDDKRDAIGPDSTRKRIHPPDDESDEEGVPRRLHFPANKKSRTPTHGEGVTSTVAPPLPPLESIQAIVASRTSSALSSQLDDAPPSLIAEPIPSALAPNAADFWSQQQLQAASRPQTSLMARTHFFEEAPRPQPL